MTFLILSPPVHHNGFSHKVKTKQNRKNKADCYTAVRSWRALEGVVSRRWISRSESGSAAWLPDVWDGTFNHCSGHYRDRRAVVGANNPQGYSALASSATHANSDRTMTGKPRFLAGCVRAISTDRVSWQECEALPAALLGSFWQAGYHIWGY